MELLTVQETAKMLKVSQMTVRRYIASGKLAAVRIGRNVRIRRDAVENFIEPVSTVDKTKKWGYGKSDEWTREHIDEHPLMQFAGMIKDEGPDDYSVNHDKYLAQAYSDMHEDDDIPFRNPDGDTTLTPLEWRLKNDPLVWTFPGGAHEGEPEYIEQREALLAELKEKHFGSGKPVDWDSPLWDIVGMIKDGPPDLSTNLDKYLVEAIMDNHEE